MKILYRQGTNRTCLSENGIHNCYFKRFFLERDIDRMSFKGHHHGYFELHAILEGMQEYEIDGKVYSLPAGSFLIVCPRSYHRAISCDPKTVKSSITFYSPMEFNEDCYVSEMSERMKSNLMFIHSEWANKKEISTQLIENTLLEIITSLFRLMGHKETKQSQPDEDNGVLALAKQFIDDNIETSPSVLDAANFCYLSTKQLTRVFLRYGNITPGEYIVKQRIARIEKYLSEDELSLKEISERMAFSSEYYFNSFFRKHAGMPPGAYRKTIGK